MARELIGSFDALLEGNRRELESLLNSPSESAKGPVRSEANDSDAPTSEREKIERFDKGELANMDAADWLNRYYQDEWRYNVRDRRKEGNELMVLCRFELPRYGIRRTQFGIAEIERIDAISQNTEREVEEAAARVADADT